MFRIRSIQQSLQSATLGAIAAGAAIGAIGCTQQVGTPVEKTADDLYLTGPTWSGGTVNVCFDGNDGNNPTLLAEAQRVLLDTWGRAANLTFPSRNPFVQPTWSQCNYSGSIVGGYSTIAIHFCGGSSNSVNCPASDYDNGRVQAGAFRGLTPQFGPVPPTGTSFSRVPGITNVSLISDDPDTFLTRFRYQVVHEFGHALGFSHEQDRPDNFTSTGNTIFCNSSATPENGGTYETPFFDLASIMDYCARDPLTGSNFPTMPSNGDVFGIRNVYGRNAPSHGFMITSDTNSTLAVNAFGGAAEGTILKLHNACTVSNPDCTWSYQRGMIVSDTDPTLAINAWGGAAEGTVLKLTRACTQSNPDCTWTYKGGQFVSDTDPTLAINAAGGAQLGTTLLLTRACTASNPDCTWTMPHVMFSSNRDSTLGVNALGGAANLVALKLHNGCDPSNTDCTWTFTKGELLSDTNTSLAVNAFGGATSGGSILLNSACTASNADCTWTWTKGELISDNRAHGALPMRAVGGAFHGTQLFLSNSCNVSNPDCVFSGLVGKN